MRSAGAITIGKTNIPEFTTGCNTFNPLFGATRNPYNLGRTAGDDGTRPNVARTVVGERHGGHTGRSRATLLWRSMFPTEEPFDQKERALQRAQPK
jgi:hypothetical protein